MEYDNMPFNVIELEQVPFELLETALYDLLRYLKNKNIHFIRSNNLPPSIAELNLYINDSPDEFDPDIAKYLGHIRIMKLSDDVTHTEMQCLLRGKNNKLFVDLVNKWKAHAATFEPISKAVRNRNKGKGLRRLKKGSPGRPSYSEDKWAWSQVNTLGRPMNEVFGEWVSNEKVKKRKLIDAKTHFHRFMKRNKIKD